MPCCVYTLIIRHKSRINLYTCSIADCKYLTPQYTSPQKSHDVTLSRQKQNMMHNLGNAQHWTSWPVATQDDFFLHLAGQPAPTKLAIVHWVGYIKTIKCTHQHQVLFNRPFKQNLGYPCESNTYLLYRLG